MQHLLKNQTYKQSSTTGMVFLPDDANRCFRGFYGRLSEEARKETEESGCTGDIHAKRYRERGYQQCVRGSLKQSLHAETELFTKKNWESVVHQKKVVLLHPQKNNHFILYHSRPLKSSAKKRRPANAQTDAANTPSQDLKSCKLRHMGKLL